MLARHCLELSCFAGPNALVPRVIKVCVTGTSAGSEPRTAAAATGNFARFLNDSALGAYETHGRCRDCWCWHVENGETCEDKNAMKVTIASKGIAVHPRLTFAGLHALQPAVTHVSVAGTSTIIIPSTTRSATTDSPGFLEHTAVWTHGDA